MYGIANGIPDYLDIRVQHRKLMARRPAEPVIPFLGRENDRDRYCFRADGSIVLWDHETGVLRASDETFPALLLRELHDLEDRLRRRLAGEHRK